ncbi:ribosomal protein L7/L12 [Candidatus Vidania fulgoroideorum]
MKKVDEIIKDLLSLNLKDLLDLIIVLKKKLNIKDSIIEKPNQKKKEDEKKNVDIIITSIGSASKLSVIRIIREITNLNLKEAKELTDQIPCTLLKNTNFNQYKEIEKKFSKIGVILKYK